MRVLGGFPVLYGEAWQAYEEYAAAWGAYFTEYRGRPEHKALGPDGQPCHAWTRGLLQPPAIEAAPSLLRIGKDSLPTVDDDPHPIERTGSEIVYTERVCPVCGEPLSDKQTYDKDACRKQADRSRMIQVDLRDGVPVDQESVRLGSG